jgi:hypothetical protein
MAKVEISTTAFAAKKTNNVGSFEFIDYFNTTIRERFWDKMDDDFVNILTSLFAGNPKATKLFLSHASWGDIETFINFLIPLSSAEASNKLDKLFSYLSTHEETLNNEVPGAIRPVVKMVLGAVDNELPEPKLLVNASNAINEQLMNFLASRQPLISGETKEFVAYLNSIQNVGGFETNILKPLIALPPYMNIRYLLNHLSAAMSQHGAQDFMAAIAELQDSSKAFADVAIRYGLIGSQRRFNIKDREGYNTWVGELYKLSPNVATTALNHLKESSSLPKKDALELFQQKANGEIDDDTLIGKSKVLAGISDNVHTFNMRFPNHDLNFSEGGRAINDERNSLFIETLLDQSYADINLESLRGIYNAWANKVLKDVPDLKRSCELYKEAKTLQENKKYNAWFGNFECPKKPTRIRLMHHLYHGIINLGDAFKNKCFEEYKLLSQRVLKAMPMITGSFKERRAEFIARVSIVLKFSDELKDIARENPPTANGQYGRLNIYNTMKTYKEEYEKAWFKNTTRINQASRLFTTTNVSLTSTGVLTHIMNTQADILKSDRNTRHNRKGYSRLYDIAEQMFLKFASDILKEPEFSLDEKKEVHSLIQQKLRTNISEFQTRLPREHKFWELKSDDGGEYSIIDASFGDSNLDTFNKTLAKHADTIPKELQYLVTNILALSEAAKAQPSADDPAPT